MDLFSTNYLMGMLQSLIAVPSFFLDRYFPLLQTEESEEIHFDVVDKTRRLAPFVSPLVAGKLVNEQGYTTKTFKPAYIKPKTVFDANAPFKRAAGEALTGASSPLSRLQLRVNAVLMDHYDQIRRRKEVMAAEALATGKVTISGDLYPTVVVDFGRKAGHNLALTGANRWGQTGVNPLKDLQTWGFTVLQASGTFPIDVILDTAAWAVFKEDPNVVDRLKRFQGAPTDLSVSAKLDEGGVYMGGVDGFNVYVYAGWYVDDAGAEQPILAPGTVILTSPQLQGVQAHGAIRDDAAGYQAVDIFAKSWTEQDPSVRYVMSQSAPLVVPTRVNASLAAAVL
jgi:hypothetical protein